MFDIGSQQLEIFLLPAVPTEHLDAVRQPQFLTSLHTVSKKNMLHLLEDKITEKKSTSVVFDCEVEFSWSLSQHSQVLAGSLYLFVPFRQEGFL